MGEEVAFGLKALHTEKWRFVEVELMHHMRQILKLSYNYPLNTYNTDFDFV